MFLSVAVATVFLALLPVYGEPFGGCQTPAYLTFDPACSAWLDSGAGLGTVLLIATLGPGALRPHLWGLAIVILLGALGGVSAVKSGAYLSLRSDPASLFALLGETGLAMIFGGVAGVGIYVFASRLRKRAVG